MVQARGGPVRGSVLGVSVVEDQVASVVRSADGQVLASNLVDLRDPSAPAVHDAIAELADSVPYDVDAIGVACARPEVQAHLTSALSATPSSPDWHRKVYVTDLPAALVEVARAEAPPGGIVAVVDLARDATPSPGLSIVTVDTTSGDVLGTSEFPDGAPAPVTEPSGAIALADAVTSMPGGSSVSTVVCTGPGAEVPGVAPAFEYAVGRPVRLAAQPALAPAVGMAVVALHPPTAPILGASSAVSRRWWMIGGAVAAALILGAAAVAAVLATVSAAEKPAPAVSTTTIVERSQQDRQTVTRTAEPVTETVTERDTVTPSRETVTRESTVTRTAPGTTVTLTETETVFPGGPPTSGGASVPSIR